ncbi:SMP-30/gluconolactonase/LRE family protein [Salinimicrobium xinjiangense]|uniref:SMP-30/gluconolactonase/LRE family protein n=1 Tax=Salinimicrobium xinjiangense TaxID=438596 RepID=UPI0004019611|nr:SMP-30/gluconolactonase/LRE family protein [Salinimicrobium xinjiangense]
MNIPSPLFITIVLFSFSGRAQNTALSSENAQLQLVSDGFEFTEGPAADAEGNIYFTDQPNNRIHKWSVDSNEVSVYMEEAGRANGLFLDAEGNLYAAADKHGEIWMINPKKEVTVLLDKFRGQRFNGPNDLWIAPDSGIFFTDPFYKRPYWNHSAQPIKEQRVYYLTPNRKGLFIAAKELVKPNGIIGTPDGKILYVADIEDNKTWQYEIGKDGKLENRKLFTGMGSDGMTMDEQGNLYLTGDGVTVFNKEGEKILHIPVDKDWTANVTFGGKGKKTLFITAMDSLFSFEMNVKGN